MKCVVRFLNYELILFSMKQRGTEFYQGFDRRFFSIDRVAELIIGRPKFKEQSVIDLERSELYCKYRRALEDWQSEIDSVLLYSNPGNITAVTNIFTNLVKQEIHFSPSLNSFTDLEVTIEDLLQQSDANFDNNQREYVGDKIVSHLTRLILPEKYGKADYSLDDQEKALIPEAENEVRKTFGFDFLRYLATIKVKVDELGQSNYERLNSALGTGVAASSFWTIAPYVHASNITTGQDSMESMKMIFELINNGRSRGIWSMPYFPLKPVKILGLDEKMPSHLIAHVQAKNIINMYNRLNQRGKQRR
jgi:hypothetical protein